MIQIEKTIVGKLIALENAKTKSEGIDIIKSAKINVKIKALSSIDEVSANELKERYFKAVKTNSNKN
jgi:hypothetical protein